MAYHVNTFHSQGRQPLTDRKKTMQTKVKRFADLSTTELYELLKLRSEIFVIEQNCVYQDIDGKDYESIHVFLEEDGRPMAYLRAFWKDEDTVQMGRVLTRHHGGGLGGRLLKEGVSQIRKLMDPKRIYIEAQCYAIGYYEREGFRVCSDQYLEDGIPHVHMTLEL